VTPDVEAFVRLAFSAQLPLKTWGAELDSIENGSVVLTCPITEPLTTAGTGIVMGGIVATLADVAAGLSIISGLDSARPVTTIDFSLHAIAAARGERLEAIGQVKKPGRSFAIASTEVFVLQGENRRLCATLTATFAVAG
jgi:uncharacterized protein (TIGR00369 family)